MSRRQAIGLLILAVLVGAGRLVRDRLLLDDEGAWREQLPLADLLPESVEEDASGPPEPFTGRLDPNRCGPDSLVLLPGIGPVIAERIVEARAEGVHFACAEDLRSIRGIGPSTIARISPHLIFPDPAQIQADGAESAFEPPHQR